MKIGRYHYEVHKKKATEKNPAPDTCFERSVTVSHRQFTSLVKCRPLLSFCCIPFLDFNTTNETFLTLSLLHFKVLDKTIYLYSFFYTSKSMGIYCCCLELFF